MLGKLPCVNSPQFCVKMNTKAVQPVAFSILFLFFPINCQVKSVSIQESKEIKPMTENSKLQSNASEDLQFSSNSFNTSNFYTQNQVQTNSKNEQKNYPLLFSVLVISFLIILVNARVFYIATSEKRRKSRSVNIFVAHLSSIAIGFTFVLLIYTLEKSNVFSVTAPGLCELLSFLRHGLFCVFPLNAVAIIYVRLTNFSRNSGALSVIRVIGLLWIIALIGSCPSIFMVEYSKDVLTQKETCKQIPIFGSYELTLAYEVFRFLTFHLLECFYMAFALFQIRSKIRYLYILKPIPNDRTKKKVQRVRYIYAHSVIFILIWLPTGVGIGIYRVLSRKWVVDGHIKNYLIPLIVLSTSLYILSPLIYLLLHEDMSEVKFWEFSLCSKRESKIGENNCENNGNEKSKRCMEKTNHAKNNRSSQKGPNRLNKLHEITDLSRISTVGVSSQGLAVQPSSTLQTEQQPHSCRAVLSASEAGELKANDCVEQVKNEAESKKFGKETPV